MGFGNGVKPYIKLNRFITVLQVNALNDAQVLIGNNLVTESKCLGILSSKVASNIN